MDIEKQLQHMKAVSGPVFHEDRILDTVKAAQEAWFWKEGAHLMDYREFLWAQLRYTRKRWWVIQAACLMLACLIIPYMENGFSRIRTIGVVGCLFVVFMIPELWRNRESDSTQVEAACLYSLRQVYAARITLFGMVDVVLLTLFCFVLREWGLTMVDVISHFLLPVTVTACICFSLLCGKQNWSEAVSLLVSLTWSAVWWLIIMNEFIYSMIVPAVWMALFGTSLAFLVTAVRKAVHTTNQCWEVILA